MFAQPVLRARINSQVVWKMLQINPHFGLKSQLLQNLYRTDYFLTGLWGPPKNIISKSVFEVQTSVLHRAFWAKTMKIGPRVVTKMEYLSNSICLELCSVSSAPAIVMNFKPTDKLEEVQFLVLCISSVIDS